MLKHHHTIFRAGALILICLLCSGVAADRPHTVVILPFDIIADSDLRYIADGMAALLPSRISMPNRINVVEGSTLRKALSPESLSSPEAKLELARLVNADFMLEGTITKIGQTISIDARVTDVRDPNSSVPVFVQIPGLDRLIPESNTLAGHVRDFVLHGRAPALETTTYVPAPDYEPSQPDHIQETPHTQTLPVPASAVQPQMPEAHPPQLYPRRAPLFEPTPFIQHSVRSNAMQVITAADLNGNGTQELVLATEDTVSIYSLANGSLEKQLDYRTGIGETIVDISAADLNGTGRDELYVTCYEGRYATSFVIELIDGAFVRLADNLKWFFRVYDHPRDGRMLIGQKADIGNPFRGEIFRFHWRDDELNYREEIILPTDINIYGFTEADIYGDGSIAYLGFNKGLFSQSYQLAVFSLTGRITWRDTNELGGSPRSFVRRMHEEDLDRSEVIPLRILCEDINRDGTLDILIAKNSRRGRGIFRTLSDYSEGVLKCLHWDGRELTPGWISPPFSEYITDYALADAHGDGNRNLYVLSVASDGFFGRAVNTISGFRPAP